MDALTIFYYGARLDNHTPRTQIRLDSNGKWACWEVWQNCFGLKIGCEFNWMLVFAIPKD
jgi:hypothetical protein